MSILIKNMEMPTSCRACHLKINCDDCEGRECVCVPLHQEIGYLDDLLVDKRRDDCPLVPVLPHGRLIDADAAMKQGWVIQRNYRKTLTDSVIEIRHIVELPTIIEAEDGE